MYHFPTFMSIHLCLHMLVRMDLSLCVCVCEKLIITGFSFGCFYDETDTSLRIFLLALACICEAKNNNLYILNCSLFGSLSSNSFR